MLFKPKIKRFQKMIKDRTVFLSLIVGTVGNKCILEIIVQNVHGYKLQLG